MQCARVGVGVDGAAWRQELASYGDWFEVWFDGGIDLSATPSLGPLVRDTWPHAVCHSCPGFRCVVFVGSTWCTAFGTRFKRAAQLLHGVMSTCCVVFGQ
jgi:hypothetical protein